MTIVRSTSYRLSPRYQIYRYNETPVPQTFNSDMIITTTPAVFNSVNSTAMPGWHYKITDRKSVV